MGLVATLSASGISLPAVVWTGIVASFISVSGVIFTIWNNTANLRKQRIHDAKEKQNDRLAVLRKEVYVQLVANLATLQGHFGRLTQADPSSPEFSLPIEAVISQLAKVELVGSDRAAVASQQYSTNLSKVLFKLMFSATPCFQAKTDIKIADNSYDEYLSESKRVAKEIALLRESGKPDVARIDGLRKSHKAFMERSSLSAEERSAAWARFQVAESSYRQTLKEQLQQSAPLLAALMAALKSDVGLIADEGQIAQRHHQANEELGAAADSFINDFKNVSDDVAK